MANNVYCIIVYIVLAAISLRALSLHMLLGSLAVVSDVAVSSTV